MRHPVEIENIEQLRRCEGIEDIELREAIDDLRVGDSVNLTLLSRAPSLAGETLQVRITSIRGEVFRGKLTQGPASAGLSELRAGSFLTFTRDHIHSIPMRQKTPEA